jgi:hypothetical protein
MYFSMEWMRNRYSVMMRLVEPGWMDGSKGHNFRSDRWIAIKLSLEFPDALVHALDEESILGDDEVWSSQAGWTVRKAIYFHRPLDRDQTVTGVSGCPVPRIG